MIFNDDLEIFKISQLKFHAKLARAMYSMHAILALAVGAAAFGSSSSATSSEDLESIEATLDHVE